MSILLFKHVTLNNSLLLKKYKESQTLRANMTCAWLKNQKPAFK